MLIKRVYTLTDAEFILNDPIIKSEISDGIVNSAPVTLVDKRSHIYLVGYVNYKPMGLFILHPNTQGAHYCHIQVIPEYRKEYSELFGRSSASWIWDNTHVTTVYADIPFAAKNVVNFSKLMGFTRMVSSDSVVAHMVINKGD